jgi:hypothetical protein
MKKAFSTTLVEALVDEDEFTCCLVHCILTVFENSVRAICVPGTGLLPGPVSELHATAVTNTSVTLQWEPPANSSNVNGFVINFQKLDNTSMHENVEKLGHVSSHWMLSSELRS